MCDHCDENSVICVTCGNAMGEHSSSDYACPNYPNGGPRHGYLQTKYQAPPKPLDYRKLWEDLKATAEFDATHHDLEVHESGPLRGTVYRTEKSERAQRLFDRMVQAETLARFKGGV